MRGLQFSVSIPQWVALKAVGWISHKSFYKGPLATVKLADVPEPELPTDEWVRVRSILCGFCASDLNLIFLKESASASPFTSFPCVIGHEVCGRIDAAGSRVTEVNTGDLVTLAPALNCAAREINPPCPACQQGMVANCENYAAGNLAPGMITGLCTDTGGGFAPYFIAHKSQVFKLPENTGPESGVLIEPLTVGLQSVFSNMPKKNEKLLIIGGGVIGTMVLKAIHGLQLECHITLCDPSATATESAKQAGADAIIRKGDLFSDAVRLTSATRYKPMMGPDILMGGFARIYDTVGSPETLNMAMRCLAAGGTLSQVGIWHDVKLDLTPLWLKQQTIKGVYGCGYANYQGEPKHMFDIALDMVSEGKIDLNGMVTHKFSLDHFSKMIEVNLAKEKHRAIKTVVAFE